MNNVELRWLVSKEDDAEKVLQFRVKEKKIYFSTETHIDNFTDVAYYEWSDWKNVPLVFS